MTTTRAMKTKPDWAGDDALSKLVDAAISNELLYERVMKPMARWTLIDTAEKNGIRWREEAKRLRADEDVKRAYEAIKDEGIEYPEYYLKPFHAYAEGNLCWLAATEAEWCEVLEAELRAAIGEWIDGAIQGLVDEAGRGSESET